MTDKKKQGGARSGSGRPEQDDPKIPIQFGLEESIVTKIGGKKKTQKVGKQLLTDHAKNI